MINTETGEVVSVVFDNKRKPKKEYVNMFESYIWTNQQSLNKLVQADNLTSATIHFLDWLLTLADMHNKLDYTRTDLERLNVFNVGSIKRYIKRLVEVNALIVDRVRGSNKYYRINRELVWKGSPKDWKPESPENQLKL